MALNWRSLTNGETLFGSAPASGVMGDEAKVANKDAMMALASQLLSGSGYSDRRSTFGQQAGQGLQAAMQARAASLQQQQKQRLIDAQIQALQAKEKQLSPFGNVNPSDFTPESLAEFQQTGNYGALKQRGGANVGNFNPGDYTPESFAKYSQTGNIADLVRYVTPSNPTVQVVNGVPTMVQGDRTGAGGPRVTPLSTQQDEIDAARLKAEAEARAKARGAVVGESEGGIEKKASAAENINAILDVADPLIDLSTGSTIGASADKVAAAFGKSLDGAQAAAQLQILQAGLMFAQPRMEGPQSVFDVQLYEKAAGQIGDPTVPAATKKAAIKTIRALQTKYKQAAERLDATKKFTSPGGATVEILD